MTEFNIEEAIGWNALRAATQAINQAPSILEDEEVTISVEIRLLSTSWPGEYPSGRSKPTLIGSAACHYRNRTEDE